MNPKNNDPFKGLISQAIELAPDLESQLRTVEKAIKALCESHPDLTINGWDDKPDHHSPRASRGLYLDLGDPHYLAQLMDVVTYLRRFGPFSSFENEDLRLRIKAWLAGQGKPTRLAIGCVIAGALLCGYESVRVVCSLKSQSKPR